ncbi:MAG TPA: hypothetical protein VLF66_10870, partial [Thermoanaerobaculia bacterium]|nr:hypothetical protein [Thermoanaerobaculia bacterium]
GLPTKVEQGDLLAVLHGTPGDAPKVVIAPATIEECYHFVPLARELAEAFRTPVMVLTDANLATGVAPFPRPEARRETLAPPVDQADWPEGLAPYDWDPATGLSPRPVPGQRGGEHTLTGLAHTRGSKVAYDPVSNETGLRMRSRKLAALAGSLKPPEVHGPPEGDLLVVGWGSTLGAIEEAVDRVRTAGHRVSSLHLRFLSPLEPGLGEILRRFERVMTVELNYGDRPGDPLITEETRRHGQLASLLRQCTLFDVDSWTLVQGQPVPPGAIERELLRRLTGEEPESAAAQAPPAADLIEVEGEIQCTV